MYLGATKQDDVKGYVTKEDDFKVAFVTMVSEAVHIRMMMLVT
jgi:DNA-dependent RNA polymerase auxiliary subunit epsilon